MACFLLFKTTHAFFFAGGEVWGLIWDFFSWNRRSVWSRRLLYNNSFSLISFDLALSYSSALNNTLLDSQNFLLVKWCFVSPSNKSRLSAELPRLLQEPMGRCRVC